MKSIIKGKVYVVENNIDTDQIIPAKYLIYSHTKEGEKEKLAKYAMSGLPKEYPPFIKSNTYKTEYNIIIAGENFGCGSSRAQAPGALHVAGVEVIVAKYFARIFFKNSVNAKDFFLFV